MRARGIELCQNSTGDLIGMRAIMHKIDYNGTEISSDAMNRIGSVPGGSSCSNLIFDSDNGNYLASIGVRYSATQVEVVRV